MVFLARFAFWRLGGRTSLRELDVRFSQGFRDTEPFVGCHELQEWKTVIAGGTRKAQNRDGLDRVDIQLTSQCRFLHRTKGIRVIPRVATMEEVTGHGPSRRVVERKDLAASSVESID